MDSDRSGAAILRTILSSDRKVTSYKLALIRAINDVATAYPDCAAPYQDVAIPFWMLAEWWIAYYWPFVGAAAPILQGQRAQDPTSQRQDMSFRLALTALRQTWESTTAAAGHPADGFVVRSELRLPRVRDTFPLPLRTAYQTACDAIMEALAYPIQYAGPAGATWSVFPRPARLAQLPPTVVAIPGTQPTDRCLLVSADLWTTFCSMVPDALTTPGLRVMRSDWLRRPLLTIPRLPPGFGRQRPRPQPPPIGRWSATSTGNTKHQPPEDNQAAGG
jgi:hypothetical protein